MESKLMPCKRCGGEATRYEEKHADEATFYGIRCVVCGEHNFAIRYFGNKPTESDYTKATEHWNRRNANDK